MLKAIFDTHAKLITFLLNQNTPVYLVGGAVRDLLSGKPTHDLDFVVLGEASALAHKTANHFGGAYYLLDEDRDTARILLNLEHPNRTIIDFARARGGSLESDLQDRDFTVNAIAMELRHQQTIDPLGGVNDLRQHVLRACSPSSFSNDPARVLRAVRFCLYHEMQMEPNTRLWLRKSVPLITRISGERIRDELFRMLEGGKGAQALRLLHATGSLDQIFPGVVKSLSEMQTQAGPQEDWEKTIQIVQQVEWLLNLAENRQPGSRENLLAAIFIQNIYPHLDAFKAHLANRITSDRSVRSLLLYYAIFFGWWVNPGESEQGMQLRKQALTGCGRNLALSNHEIERGRTILENTPAIYKLIQQAGLPDRQEIFDYFDRSGESGIDLCLIALGAIKADTKNVTPDVWEEMLGKCSILFSAWWNHRKEYVDPPALISGEDLLQQFSQSPGPWVGQILKRVRMGQALGNINTRQEALELAQKIFGEVQGKI